MFLLNLVMFLYFIYTAAMPTNLITRPAEQVRQVRQLPDHLLAYPVHLYGAAMNT